MSAALSSLLRKASIEDHDEVLAQCDSDLKQKKNDLNTLHVKAVALLHLNRFEDAARVFDEAGESLKKQAALEYAYALYKAGDAEKAAEVAKDLASTGGQHLQAQVAYRLEDFANASGIYQSLAQKVENEENDIRINLNATYAQLVWKGEGGSVRKRKAEREDLEVFDAAYNAACLAIARNELSQAEVLLKRARDLCNAAEELSTEQRQEELLNIMVQQLYVLVSLGKSEAAEALAQQITSESIPDTAMRRISTINKLVAGHSTNPYLMQRLLDAIPVLSAKDQFFAFQTLLTEKNDLAASLACSKIEGVKRSTTKYINSVSGPSLDPKINIASTANAAAHAQGQLGKAGLKAITPLFDKRPYDIGLLATVIQLYILTGNNGAAIHVMDKFLQQLTESGSASDLDARFSPGLLAMAVSLYSKNGRKSFTETELAKAASYWKTKQKPPVELLKAAGISLLEHGDHTDIKLAGEVFNLLHETNPEDKIVKAGLASASSELTQPIDTKFLSSVERLTTGVDVAALDAAGIPISTASTTAALLKRKRAELSSSKKPRKRLRKSQLPKDFDPNKQMDPERWLPLRDRSTYRPKGRKAKQKQSTATQGSNEKPAEGVNAPEKSTVATAPTSNKAKKKKSKK